MIGLLWLGISGCGYNAYSVRGVNTGLDGAGSCSLLLEAEIRIWSDFDGTVLPDVGDSALASAAASTALIGEFEARFGRQLRLLQPSPGDTQRLLREYLALYSLLSDQALRLSRAFEPRWRHKRGDTDLGVGPELLQLVGATGCGSAIVLSGFQLPVSGAGVAPGVPVGRAVLSLGVLDLGSGEIIWVNRIIQSVGRDLMQGENLRLAIDRLLKGYPA